MPEVSAVIGVGQTSIYRWEWGKACPHYTDLEKLASLYGLTVGQLVDGAQVDGVAS